MFFKSLSYLYEIVHTNFSLDFWTFAIFDRNFATIVTPPSDEYENYVVQLKEQSLLKIMLQTTSKSAYKWQRNAWSNYAPLDSTVLRTRSVTKKTPHFSIYSRHVLYDLPQTLHGDRARRAHQKGVIHFSIQRIFFPIRCSEKFGLIDRRTVSQQ